MTLPIASYQLVATAAALAGVRWCPGARHERHAFIAASQVLAYSAGVFRPIGNALEQTQDVLLRLSARAEANNLFVALN